MAIKSILHKIKTPGNILIPGVFVFLVISILPLISLLPGTFTFTDNWNHIVETKLFTYSLNSLIMVAGTLAGTLLLALPSAYVMARYSFPGKTLFEILLMSPLAVPPYLLVFGYAGLSDSMPLIQNILYSNHFGAILILSFSFYPYLYVPLRWSFHNSLSEHQDLIRVYALKEHKTISSILLPLSRFALLGGLSIVTMEVLSEYGALHYLGIDTLTTGIFRTWFHYYDLSLTRKLALLLLIPTAGILFFESRLKRKSSVNTVHKPYKEIKNMKAVIWALIPVIMAILLPMYGLMKMSFYSSFAFDPMSIVNTFTLVIPALLISLASAIIIHVFALYKKTDRPRILPVLIHGIPSAILVLGVLAVLGIIDPVIPVSGTLGLLVAIYVIKYSAVPIRSLMPYFKGRGVLMHELGRSMGKTPFTIIAKIHIPQLMKPMLAASVLLFADMIKELPIAMMLRPFNFNTLAIETYQLASNEQLYDAALPALCLMMLGLLAGAAFNFLKEKKND